MHKRIIYLLLVALICSTTSCVFFQKPYKHIYIRNLTGDTLYTIMSRNSDFRDIYKETIVKPDSLIIGMFGFHKISDSILVDTTILDEMKLNILNSTDTIIFYDREIRDSVNKAWRNRRGKYDIIIYWDITSLAKE